VQMVQAAELSTEHAKRHMQANVQGLEVPQVKALGQQGWNETTSKRPLAEQANAHRFDRVHARPLE